MADNRQILTHSISYIPITFIFSLLIFSCKKNTPLPDPIAETLYFPPVGDTDWMTASPASLEWNTSTLNDLHTFLQAKNTKAFIILKNGKIVVERYFGTFTQDSLWLPFSK